MSAAHLPPWRPVLLAAAACAAVALVLRLWTLSAMEAANPLFAEPLLDEAAYLGLAKEGWPDQAWFQSPVFPALLRSFGITQRHDAAVLCAVLGSATAGLAVIGGAHQARSVAAGWIAGALAALAAGPVFLDVTVQTESLLALLTLLAVLAMTRAAALPSPCGIAAAGAAVGLAALARGNALGLLLGALPILLREGPEGGRAALRTTGRRAGALAAGLLLVLLPAAGVHASRGGGLTPFPWTGGLNLWLGNCAWAQETRSFGTDQLPMDPVGEEIAARRLAEQDEGRPLTGTELSSWWSRRALREAADAPGALAGHLAVKAGLVLTADEIGGNHDAVAEAPFAPWTRWTPVSVWWILALGAGGWVLVRRGTPSADVLALAVVGHAATLVLTFPLSRYRMPVVPIAAVLAGAGLWIALRGRPDRRRLLLAGAAAAAVAAVAFLPLRPHTRPEAWTNLGEAVRLHGRGDPAPWYERAVADSPLYGPPRERLGHLALDARRNDEALAHFLVAERWPAVRRSALVGRGRALSNLGRHDDALAVNATLVDENPGDAVALAEGALLGAVAGRFDDARRLLERAESLAPDDPEVRSRAAEVRRRLPAPPR